MDLQSPLTPELMQPAPTRGVMRQLVSAGDLRLVLGFDEAREYVDNVPGLTRVPGAPAWLLGLFPSEGTAVPLVDIAAWAQRTEPAHWTQARAGSARSFDAAHPATRSASALRALRFGEGEQAWAIRLSQAPAVLDLNDARHQPLSNDLPLRVSAINGALVHHAAQAWFLPGGAVALQIKWPQVAKALQNELSGLVAA